MTLQQTNQFIAFPFSVSEKGTATVSIVRHIRDQIELLLFTAPKERVLRPEYGAGISSIVFEPLNGQLVQLIENRIQVAVLDLLEGKAGPETIEVSVTKSSEETLEITVAYTLAVFDLAQQHCYDVTLSPEVSPLISWDSEEVDALGEDDAPIFQTSFFKNNNGKWDASRFLDNLPHPLPLMSEEIDYNQADWDSFRFSMVSELKRTFPQRKEWSISDLEVILIEVLAYALDLLSDKADRVFQNSFLQTTISPRRLYHFAKCLNYNLYRSLPPREQESIEVALTHSQLGTIEHNRKETDLFTALWHRNPEFMDIVKKEAPGDLFTQQRMVTEEDAIEKMCSHPLIASVTVYCDGDYWFFTCTVPENLSLDTKLSHCSKTLLDKTEQLHRSLDLYAGSGVCWFPKKLSDISIRTLLERYIEVFRLANIEIELVDANPVGVNISATIAVRETHYRCEIRHRVETLLSNCDGGLFSSQQSSRIRSYHISDLYEELMAIEGVINIAFTQFEPVSMIGKPAEVMTCLEPIDETHYFTLVNDETNKELGMRSLTFTGGIER